MNINNLPQEIQDFVNKYHEPIEIVDYERYENIYEVFFIRVDTTIAKRVYIRVYKQNQMSDTNIER